MSTKFINYRIGIRNLLDTLGKEHPKYLYAVNFESQLSENLHDVEAYGDNENYRTIRNKIIYQIIINIFQKFTIIAEFTNHCLY